MKNLLSILEAGFFMQKREFLKSLEIAQELSETRFHINSHNNHLIQISRLYNL